MSKTMTIDLKRVIAGSPAKVYDAWMDRQERCNPWGYGKSVVMEPKVGRPFVVVMGSAGAHFGRILSLSKGKALKHTWMSYYTRGLESTVSVAFKKHPGGTLMTLRHSGLPKDSFGRAHIGGWGDFLGMMEKRFAKR